LSIEGLPIPQTTSQELRPGAVAMLADSGAQFLYFCNQFVSRKLLKVFVRHCARLDAIGS